METVQSVVARVYLLAPFIIYLAKVAADIECACTTDECQRDGLTTCTATNMCYVQYLPDEPRPLVRGCIDERTPLLCENRRPKMLVPAWPVLHCCRNALCNKNVLPTMPPWMENQGDISGDIEGPRPSGRPTQKPWEELWRQQAMSTTPPIGYPDFEQSQDRARESIDSSHKQELHQQASARRTRTAINPLYIGVPVAGACVLLAIIIFAIYVLKRQNQYVEEYRYHSTLRHPPHKSTATSVKDTRTRKHDLYAECEQSSSSSVTKLLMKV